MGSGERFKLFRIKGVGLGIFFDGFPFQYTITITILTIGIQLAFGKAYDE
jgi:hypothetical protein